MAPRLDWDFADRGIVAEEAVDENVALLLESSQEGGGVAIADREILSGTLLGK